MAATQTATRRTTRNAKPVKLSPRGCGVVATVVAGLVALAGSGHVGAATLGAILLYLLVGGGASAVAAVIPDARQALRGVCWIVVALAALAAAQGSTAPGGPTLGFALAAALATYLRLSARRTR